MSLWRDVPGYEGLYKVTIFGNVLGVKRGKFLKPHTDRFLRLKRCVTGWYEGPDLNVFGALLTNAATLLENIQSFFCNG